jgi:hypothetical protein
MLQRAGVHTVQATPESQFFPQLAECGFDTFFLLIDPALKECYAAA